MEVDRRTGRRRVCGDEWLKEYGHRNASGREKGPYKEDEVGTGFIRVDTKSRVELRGQKPFGRDSRGDSAPGSNSRRSRESRTPIRTDTSRLSVERHV